MGADETSRGSYRYKLRRYAEDARDDKAYALFVFREEDDALVGGVTLSNVRRGVAPDRFAWLLGRRRCSPARATSPPPCALAVRYAFEDLACTASRPRASRTISASRRVLEKAGFTQEGMARAYLKINGQWRDHCAVRDRQRRRVKAPLIPV